MPTKERLRIANNGSQKLVDAQARIVEHRQTQDRSLPTAPNGLAYLLLLAMDCRQVATLACWQQKEDTDGAAA